MTEETKQKLNRTKLNTRITLFEIKIFKQEKLQKINKPRQNDWNFFFKSIRNANKRTYSYAKSKELKNSGNGLTITKRIMQILNWKLLASVGTVD